MIYLDTAVDPTSVFLGNPFDVPPAVQSQRAHGNTAPKKSEWS
jgi:hypothetical protein